MVDTRAALGRDAWWFHTAGRIQIKFLYSYGEMKIKAEENFLEVILIQCFASTDEKTGSRVIKQLVKGSIIN